jgi:isopenicillin-N epimerase
VDAPIVSWGHGAGSTFRSRAELQGTRDPAAYLAVPEAIRFQAERDWDGVRERCRALARAARAELCALAGSEPIAPDALVAQLAAVELPACEGAELERRLFAEHRIEIPVSRGPRPLLRLSVAAYTRAEDVRRLLDVLPALLSTSRSPGAARSR